MHPSRSPIPMDYEPVIGLEVHTQLSTQSKLFCGCSTEYGCQPNQNTCSVCLGLPGALPVFNQKVLELAVRLGIATHCTIRTASEFSRKNYLYPDLPKAYQISQYDLPICEKGWVEIHVNGVSKRIALTRIHIEEDAGKLIHDPASRSSFVDLNRAGVPLLEIVSEPVIENAEEAKIYLETLHRLVTDLQISDGDMEKGNFRCDANVSIRPRGTTTLGTRTETKNINSFKFVQQAILYEMNRQRDELLEGRSIRQETRLWNSEKKQNYAMRSKENANDYRYFPDPDLPVLRISQKWIDSIRKNLPELPDAKKKRLIDQYGLSPSDADALVSRRTEFNLLEEMVLTHQVAPKTASNWILTEGLQTNEEGNPLITHVNSADLASLIRYEESGQINHRQAKIVFTEMATQGKNPGQIIEEQGFQQISDESTLQKIVLDLMEQNPEQVSQYRAGKTKVFGFFVGALMKATQGQANPQKIQQLLEQYLHATNA